MVKGPSIKARFGLNTGEKEKRLLCIIIFFNILLDFHQIPFIEDPTFQVFKFPKTSKNWMTSGT